MWGHSVLPFQTASAAVPEHNFSAQLPSAVSREPLLGQHHEGRGRFAVSVLCWEICGHEKAAVEPTLSSLTKGQGSVRSLETGGVSDWLWNSCLDGCVLCCTQRPLQVYIKVLPRLNQCIFSFSPLNAFLSFRLSPVFPGKGCWLGEVWQSWTPSFGGLCVAAWKMA